MTVQALSRSSIQAGTSFVAFKITARMTQIIIINFCFVKIYQMPVTRKYHGSYQKRSRSNKAEFTTVQSLACQDREDRTLGTKTYKNDPAYQKVSQFYIATCSCFLVIQETICTSGGRYYLYKRFVSQRQSSYFKTVLLHLKHST